MIYKFFCTMLYYVNDTGFLQKRNVNKYKKRDFGQMISFNVPPKVGTEEQYISEAIQSRKICGDGQFTKKCNAWLEEKTGTAKALLTTSCTHATEMAALLADIQPGDEGYHAFVYICIDGRCICTSRSQSGIRGYQT